MLRTRILIPVSRLSFVVSDEEGCQIALQIQVTAPSSSIWLTNLISIRLISFCLPHAFHPSSYVMKAKSKMMIDRTIMSLNVFRLQSHYSVSLSRFMNCLQRHLLLGTDVSQTPFPHMLQSNIMFLLIDRSIEDYQVFKPYKHFKFYVLWKIM